MKTVRLSGSLPDDIRDNIRNAHERVHPEKSLPTEEGYEVLERYGVLEKIDKTKTLLQDLWEGQVPYDMGKEVDLDNVVIKCELATNTDSEGETHYEMSSFNLSGGGLRIPAFVVGDSYYNKSLTVPVPSDDATLVKCQEAQMENEMNAKNRRNQVEQFNTLIDEHNITTLNQLLKAASWLEAYIPADRLQKMNEKDDRVKRVQEQREFADDAMADIRETMLEDKLTGDIFNE